jgi:GNAT superfamily N-acetyltransferase
MQLDAIEIKTLPVHAGEAQVPDEVVAIDRLTFTSWGGGLTLEQYLERERRLRACAYSRGLRQWVLREGNELLASCESYAVPFVLSGADGSRQRSGLGHGIASVYVEARLRGRGYAGELLRRTHDRLRSEGALCAYLMSEIGPSLYSRLGYVARPLRLCRFAAVDPAREAPHPEDWTWLTEADVAARLQTAFGATSGVPRPGLSVETTPAQIEWHLLRGRFYAEKLQRKPAVRVGAAAGEAFVLWQPEYRRGALQVLALWPGRVLWREGQRDPRSREAADLRNVLHAARAAATDLGLSTVEIWETPRSATFLRGGARIEAKDLPMLLPLAPGVRAEDWTDYERAHWL